MAEVNQNSPGRVVLVGPCRCSVRLERARTACELADLYSDRFRPAPYVFGLPPAKVYSVLVMQTQFSVHFLNPAK